MNAVYRYNPDDFKGILGLPDELYTFYNLHEKYSETKSRDDRFALENHWENLLFYTIKHREIEGAITQPTAIKMREYVEGMLYD